MGKLEVASRWRTSITRSNGTKTDYAYESDSDLDWMRHVYQGGTTATAPNDTWMGIDYGYDASGRVTQIASTDSRIMGAMPNPSAYSPANNLNQVANAGNRFMTWSDAGNMATDGRGTTFTHDGRNRLIKAVKGEATTLVYDYAVSGYRIQSIKNPSSISANGMPLGGTRTRFVLSGAEDLRGRRHWFEATPKGRYRWQQDRPALLHPWPRYRRAGGASRCQWRCLLHPHRQAIERDRAL
jgi:hypothetical protein